MCLTACMFRRVSGAGMPSGPGPGGWGPFLHGDRSPALDPQQPGTSVRPQASPSLRAQQLRGQCGGEVGYIKDSLLRQWQLLLSSILRHAGLGDSSHCNRSGYPQTVSRLCQCYVQLMGREDVLNVSSLKNVLTWQCFKLLSPVIIYLEKHSHHTSTPTL